MPDDRDDSLPSDIPHDVLRQKYTDAIRHHPGLGLTLDGAVDAVMAVRDEELKQLRARLAAMTSLHADERFALTTLRDMIANLQDHIDYRAAEIAAPRITAAEEAAAARVATAEQERDQWRQRFEDLQREHERQVSVWEKQRDRLRPTRP